MRWEGIHQPLFTWQPPFMGLFVGLGTRSDLGAADDDALYLRYQRQCRSEQRSVVDRNQRGRTGRPLSPASYLLRTAAVLHPTATAAAAAAAATAAATATASSAAFKRLLLRFQLA